LEVELRTGGSRTARSLKSPRERSQEKNGTANRRKCGKKKKRERDAKAGTRDTQTLTQGGLRKKKKEARRRVKWDLLYARVGGKKRMGANGSNRMKKNL